MLEWSDLLEGNWGAQKRADEVIANSFLGESRVAVGGRPPGRSRGHLGGTEGSQSCHQKIHVLE